jgi:hypothetical protein
MVLLGGKQPLQWRTAPAFGFQFAFLRRKEKSVLEHLISKVARRSPAAEVRQGSHEKSHVEKSHGAKQRFHDQLGEQDRHGFSLENWDFLALSSLVLIYTVIVLFQDDECLLEQYGYVKGFFLREIARSPGSAPNGQISHSEFAPPPRILKSGCLCLRHEIEGHLLDDLVLGVAEGTKIRLARESHRRTARSVGCRTTSLDPGSRKKYWTISHHRVIKAD